MTTRLERRVKSWNEIAPTRGSIPEGRRKAYTHSCFATSAKCAGNHDLFLLQNAKYIYISLLPFKNCTFLLLPPCGRQPAALLARRRPRLPAQPHFSCPKSSTSIIQKCKIQTFKNPLSKNLHSGKRWCPAVNLAANVKSEHIFLLKENLKPITESFCKQDFLNDFRGHCWGVFMILNVSHLINCSALPLIVIIPEVYKTVWCQSVWWI